MEESFFRLKVAYTVGQYVFCVVLHVFGCDAFLYKNFHPHHISRGAAIWDPPKSVKRPFNATRTLYS